MRSLKGQAIRVLPKVDVVGGGKVTFDLLLSM